MKWVCQPLDDRFRLRAEEHPGLLALSTPGARDWPDGQHAIDDLERGLSGGGAMIERELASVLRALPQRGSLGIAVERGEDADGPFVEVVIKHDAESEIVAKQAWHNLVHEWFTGSRMVPCRIDWPAWWRRT